MVLSIVKSGPPSGESNRSSGMTCHTPFGEPLCLCCVTLPKSTLHEHLRDKKSDDLAVSVAETGRFGQSAASRPETLW